MSIFDIFSKNREKNKKSSRTPVRQGVATADKISLNSRIMAYIRNCYIAFDVETTGLDPATDRIIELGAVVFVNGKIDRTFSSLVNPKTSISRTAAEVNHITSGMLKKAPCEEEIYPKLIEFLGEALNGKIVMCAHNARFDFNFLCNTLSRLGFDADIRYLDTLDLARKYLNLNSYKQSSIEAHFGLTNVASHRAMSDAENCGHILYRLLDIAEKSLQVTKNPTHRSPMPSLKPDQQELEVCAYIQSQIIKQGGDAKILRYRKNSGGYIAAYCPLNFLKFKFSKKGRYILVKNNSFPVSDYVTEPCTQAEGGTDFVRVFFSSPFDLEPFSKYIYDTYINQRNFFEKNVLYDSTLQQKAEENISATYTLSDEEVCSLLKTANERDYAPVSSDNITITQISRDDVKINAIHSRVPLSEILNQEDWKKGFMAGAPSWEKGETARKAGRLEEAIELFDEARYKGYSAPELYTSYALVYRQLRDFSNEIIVLDEGIARIPDKVSLWNARRNKAIHLLFMQQEKERKAIEKERKKAEKQKQKEAAITRAKQPHGKAVIQMDDAGNVIKIFETIAVAAKETEINSKSIRDAANGIQKHAGGFCWEYERE